MRVRRAAGQQGVARAATMPVCWVRSCAFFSRVSTYYCFIIYRRKSEIKWRIRNAHEARDARASLSSRESRRPSRRATPRRDALARRERSTCTTDASQCGERSGAVGETRAETRESRFRDAHARESPRERLPSRSSIRRAMWHTRETAPARPRCRSTMCARLGVGSADDDGGTPPTEQQRHGVS